MKKKRLKSARKTSDQIRAELQGRRAAQAAVADTNKAVEAERRVADELQKIEAKQEAGEALSLPDAKKLLEAAADDEVFDEVPGEVAVTLRDFATSLPVSASLPKGMEPAQVRAVAVDLIGAWRVIRRVAPDAELDKQFLALKRPGVNKVRQLRDTLLERLKKLSGVDQEAVEQDNTARKASLVSRAVANDQLADTPAAKNLQAQASEHADNLAKGGDAERSSELRDNLLGTVVEDDRSGQMLPSLSSEALIRVYDALGSMRLPRKATQQQRGEFGERLLQVVEDISEPELPSTVAALLFKVRTDYDQLRKRGVRYTDPAFEFRLPEEDGDLEALSSQMFSAVESALDKRPNAEMNDDGDFVLVSRAAPAPEPEVVPEVAPEVVPEAVPVAAVDEAEVVPEVVPEVEAAPAAVVDDVVETPEVAEPVAEAAVAVEKPAVEPEMQTPVATPKPTVEAPKKLKKAKPQPLSEAEIDELISRLNASPEEERALAALTEYYELLTPQDLARRALKYGIESYATPLEIAYEDWYQLRRNNIIRSQRPGVKLVEVPQAADEVTPELLRALSRFQRQTDREVLKRAERMEDLIVGAEDVETMTDKEIVDYVFSDLNITQRDELMDEDSIKDFADFVKSTVENRFLEVDTEVQALRTKSGSARKLAERFAKSKDEAKQERAKRLVSAADMYDQRADRLERATTAAREQGLDRMVEELGDLRPMPVDEDAVNIKGMTYFVSDASAILYALRSADTRTGIHEIAHVMRRVLPDANQRVVQDWVNSRLASMDGSNGQSLTPISIDARKQLRGAPESVVQGEELFAEAFDQYLREGVIPNKRMGTVFATIKALFRKIVGMLSRQPERIEISPEMYQLFDEIFGGVTTLTADNVASVGRAISTKRSLDDVTLGDFPPTPFGIPLMRITSQGVQEATPVERYRQFTASLADYRARGFLPRVLEGVAGSDIRSAGPGQSEAARVSGPITRRVLSIEARRTPDAVRDRMFRNLDVAAVTVASGMEAVIFGLVGLGADPIRTLRSLQPAMRSLLRGIPREVEESTNTISTIMNDISRRVSHASKAKSVSDLANALEGIPVQLQTGAQRGRIMTGTGVNAAEGVFASLRRYVNVLDESSKEALVVAAENQLARMAGKKVGKLGGADSALMGLWRGLEKRPKEFAGDYTEGLHVKEDLLLADIPGLVTKNKKVEGIEQLTQDMLQDILRAITGDLEGIDPNSVPDARNLAAVLLFYAGVVDLRSAASRVSADDLMAATGKSRMSLLIEGVEKVIVDDVEVSKVFGLFRGFSFPADRRSTAVMTMGVYGTLSKTLEDSFAMGVGLNSGDFRAYYKYISNLGSSMSDAEIARAQHVERVYGYDIDFEALDTRFGRMYVPRSVRKEVIDNAVGRAKRELGLTPDAIGAKDTYLSFLSQHIMVNTLFGNAVTRMTYLLPATLDIFRGVASEAGFTAGLASMMRTAPQAILNIPITGPVSVARAAETAEAVGGGWLARNIANLRRPNPQGDAAVENFKNGLRTVAGRLGDRWGRAVSEFFSAAKFRVETAPIMEADPNVIFNIGDTLYRASDLRRIFAREGLYSNPFKLIAQENRRASRDFLTGRLSSQSVSKDNKKMVDSMAETMESYLYDHEGAALRGTRSTYSFVMEHGVEATDSFADFERTGSAVSLMEQGMAPEYAARVVVSGLYDYRGSMTSTDRSFLRRILMPFFAFRKNATTHTINLMTSPRGIFMVRALERLPRMTATAATNILYEAAVGPYGVDVSGMNPYQRDLYYSLRNYLEFGLGEDAVEEDLNELRKQLPEDQRDMSREELLQHDFNGWSALNGYGSYDNVPDDVRSAVRGLIANTSVVRSSGVLYRVNQTLFDPEARAQFAAIGSVAVRPEPGQAGLPGYAAQRYPTVQVFLPNMTPSVQEVVARGMQQSFYLSFPDSMIFAGLEHITASMATTMLAGRGVARMASGEASKADFDAVLNTMEPIVDFRGMGGPVPKTLYDITTNLTGSEQAYMELHPYMARRFEGTFGTTPSYEGAPDDAGINIRGLSARTRMMLAKTLAMTPTVFEAVGSRLGVEVETPFKSARLGRVVVRDGRREIEYFDRPGEYVTEEAVYKPFLVGMPAVIAQRTVFGEINRLLLAAEAATSASELAKIDSDLQNLLTGYAADTARAAGVRVFPYDEERTARAVGSAIPR